MTHEDAGHYASKHPKGEKLDPGIAEAVKKKVSDGKITCAAAHKIAGTLDVPVADVGVAIDLLEARLAKCQLGLFGYYPEKKIVKPMESIPGGLEEAVRESLTDNRISCAACWKLAEQFDCTRLDVSSSCESMGIKISPCQLGAF